VAPFDDILLGRSLIGALCVTVHLYDSPSISQGYTTALPLIDRTTDGSTTLTTLMIILKARDI